MSTPVPFKPETWPLDADGHESNLCTICGTPVRYGSRHSRCARPEDFKPMDYPIPSQEATADPDIYDAVRDLRDAFPDAAAIDTVPMPQSADQAEMMLKLAWMWLSTNAPDRLRPPTPAADQQTERLDFEAWVKGDPLIYGIQGSAAQASALDRDRDDDYANHYVHNAWVGWCARGACFAGGSPARDVEAPAAIGSGAWIDIKVRRPELFEKVLLLGTYYSENTAVVGVMDSAIGDFKPTFVMDPSPHEGEYDKAEIWNVTHWMPLPAAPIGSDK